MCDKVNGRNIPRATLHCRQYLFNFYNTGYLARLIMNMTNSEKSVIRNPQSAIYLYLDFMSFLKALGDGFRSFQNFCWPAR